MSQVAPSPVHQLEFLLLPTFLSTHSVLFLFQLHTQAQTTDLLFGGGGGGGDPKWLKEE